jgi:hypothetical protein
MLFLPHEFVNKAQDDAMQRGRAIDTYGRALLYRVDSGRFQK